jgi:hypothetical protein
MDRSKRWPAAIIAGGLVAFAALIGCGGEQTVASKSATAFREAQKRGETFGSDGHAHGPGAAAPGEELAPAEGVQREEATSGHAHGAGEESSTAGGMRHEGEHGGRPDAPDEHRGHAAMERGRRAAAPSGHAGHGAMPQEAPPAATPPAGHAGHAPSPVGAQPAPLAPAPVAVPPGQPAATLRPDPLDAPAATSLAAAQSSAAMAQEMAGGGHGGHSAGNYRQVDAGRGPQASQEEKKDINEEHQHEPPDPGGAAPVERRQG